MSLVQNPKFLSCCCFLLSRVGILHIQFNRKSRKTELTINPRDKTNWINRLHAIFVIVVICQAVVKNSEFSLQGVHVWVGVLVQIFTHVLVCEQEKKGQEIAHFCSALFQFEDMYPTTPAKQHRVPLPMKLITVMVNCIMGSTFIVPFGFVYCLHWINPCRASLVGYWFLPECHERKSILPVKLVIMLLNHWMISVSFNSAAFTVCVLTTMSISSIQQFIQRFAFDKN